jgi:hypothetical protein
VKEKKENKSREEIVAEWVERLKEYSASAIITAFKIGSYEVGGKKIDITDGTGYSVRTINQQGDFGSDELSTAFWNNIIAIMKKRVLTMMGNIR